MRIMVVLSSLKNTTRQNEILIRIKYTWYKYIGIFSQHAVALEMSLL